MVKYTRSDMKGEANSSDGIILGFSYFNPQVSSQENKQQLKDFQE